MNFSGEPRQNIAAQWLQTIYFDAARRCFSRVKMLDMSAFLVSLEKDLWCVIHECRLPVVDNLKGFLQPFRF